MIYQPNFNGLDFTISLDNAFARKMMNSKLAEYTKFRLNEICNNQLKELNIYWSSPLIFHESSALLSQANIGQNGKWLATTNSDIQNILKDNKDVKYHTHNIDTTHDAYALLTLFDTWIHYSDILAE